MASEAILRAENEKVLSQSENLEYENEQLKLSLEDSKKQSLDQEAKSMRLVADLQASVERCV